MKKKFKEKNKGFMMVEILIVISIIVISVLAAMTITEKAMFVSRQSLHTEQASYLLEEGAEVVRIMRDDSWSNISGLTVGSVYYPTFTSAWTLSSTTNNVGIFTRTVSISNVNRDATTSDISSSGVDDSGTKLVTVTVSWPEDGVTLSKTLSFYIMDIF